MLKKQHRSGMHKFVYLSILEGIYSQIFMNLANIGSVFITKFAVLLQAAPIHFSILTAIGQVSYVFQPLGLAVTHHLKRRKQACIRFAFIGRIVPFLFGLSLYAVSPQYGIWLFLLLLLFSTSMQYISSNIWIAWISDTIPNRIRGRFFSARNQILMAVGMLFSYLLSLVGDLFSPTKGSLAAHFKDYIPSFQWLKPANQGIYLAGVFVIAGIIGIAGLRILAKQPERRKQPGTDEWHSALMEPLKDSNFRKLLLFGSWWMLTCGIGSAFWYPFILKHLQMTLFEAQLYGSLTALSMMFSFRFWGKLIDLWGNKFVMQICIILGGINPLLWLFFTPESHALIWVESVTAGFMWSGANLVATNFVLAIAPRGKEQAYSGLYGAVTGVAMMITTLLSGFLFPPAMKLGPLELQPEQVLFGITGVLRWTAEIPLLWIRDVKKGPLASLLGRGHKL